MLRYCRPLPQFLRSFAPLLAASRTSRVRGGPDQLGAWGPAADRWSAALACAARRWHGASALAASAWARARGGGEWIRPARNRLISGVDACGEPPTTCGGRRPVPIRCPAGDCARSGRATARFSGGESRARAQVASGPWRPPAPVYDPRPADRWMHPLPSIGSSERCRKGLRHRS